MSTYKIYGAHLGFSHDIIFLINLIYSLDYRPSIEFLNLSRKEIYTYEEAKNNLQTIIAESNMKLAKATEKIEAFLNKEGKDQFIQEVRHVIGLILWKTHIFD